MISSQDIKKRMFAELFDRPILDNTARGYFCESMAAEALGRECKIVGAGWHAWDLQIGSEFDTFPNRIRIQVKNSAKIQPWNMNNGKMSECQFGLKIRTKPSYFERDNPSVFCEEIGFLSELFILCFHENGDLGSANQLDPMQWKFFLVPVVGPKNAITEKELAWAVEKVRKTGKPATVIRLPETLERGIRGRPPIPSIGIGQLSLASVRQALGLS